MTSQQDVESVRDSNKLDATASEDSKAMIVTESIFSRLENKEHDAAADDTTDETARSDHAHQRLRWQAPAAVSPTRTHILRSQSTPPHERHRAALRTQDIAFLGPLDGTTSLKRSDAPTYSEEIVILKEQLRLALENLQCVKVEVRELRNTLLNRSGMNLTTNNIIFESEEVLPKAHHVSILENQLNPCPTTSPQETVLDTQDDENQNTLKHNKFPWLGGIQRHASPLPAPNEPGVSSAFLDGQPIQNSNEQSTMLYASTKSWYPSNSKVSPEVETQTLEYLAALPQGEVANSDASHSRFNHLSFFRGTSNTPLAHLQHEEDCKIWTPQAPLAPTPSVSEYTGETESLNDKGELTNYKRVMDRNSDLDWHHVVSKIVLRDDQQASVALQQKLKNAPTHQKLIIIDAIVLQAYPLMINRFGNFLIQRCFEHGTTNQVDTIANAILGSVQELSKDAFGCHVVQKAFDNVSDEYKTCFVAELLTCIKETVTHRYACHVWQKLFELRWDSKAPEVMSHVNAELAGQWDEIAMSETGSLVVQNIFENCVEAEKTPCLEEILEKIPVVVRGQWGNWVVQHIVEYGSASARSRALDALLANATEYSVDQYASKVIEKAIKSGDREVLRRYLAAVTSMPADAMRPRMPLIDIASDQYGNYLIQYILTNGEPEQRATVAAHIRKHMVSMRGSRYGAKVAFTVERMRHEMIEDRSTRNYRATQSQRNRGSCHHANTSRHALRGSRDEQ